MKGNDRMQLTQSNTARTWNRIGWILVGAACLLTFRTVMAKDATHKNQSSENGQPDKTFVETKSISVGATGTLTVDSDFGSIELIPTDSKKVDVEVTRTIAGKYLADAQSVLKLHDVKVASQNNDARVTAKLNSIDVDAIQIPNVEIDLGEDLKRAVAQALRRRLKHVHLRISVPRAYNSDVLAQGGQIVVGDLGGHVRCKSGGGAVHVGHIGGSCNVQTGGGCVTLASSVGDADLRTSGGTIKTGAVNGNLSAQTKGGSIHLGPVSGETLASTAGGTVVIEDASDRVQVTTAGGSIRAAMTGQPSGDSFLRTGGGNIVVNLAKELSIDVQARTANGAVEVPSSDQRKDKGDFQGRLNGGGPKLRIDTASGNIRVRLKSKQTPSQLEATAQK